MKLNQEQAKLLREVVAAIPQVVETIAGFPMEHRAAALEAAERGYLRAMLESGFEEATAQKWATAVMRRLRSQAAERDSADRRRMTNALHEELSPLAPQINSTAENKREAEPFEDEELGHVAPEDGVRDYLAAQERAGRRERRAAVALPRPDNGVLANYAALIRRWRATVLASIEAAAASIETAPSSIENLSFGLSFLGSLCLGIAAGLVVSLMESATFQPYLVGLLLFVGVWLLMLALLHRENSK